MTERQSSQAPLTRRQLLTEARRLGSAAVGNMTGQPQDVVGRWIAGGVNAEVERLFRAALSPKAKG